jgi:hypothetical protein
MTSPDEELRAKIAAEAVHAEATKDAELAYRRRSRSSVYGLRLPDERIEQLRRLAAARGVEPSVLVRQWVIDQLDASERGRDRDSERWERDFRTTADHLRQLLDHVPWADAS